MKLTSKPNGPGDMLGFVGFQARWEVVQMAKKQRRTPRYQIEERLSKRIPANLAEQAKNNSYNPPEYYEDMQFKCVDCGTEEIWTAKQQKWWYEIAKGPIFSKAVRCRVCRNKLRDNHQGTTRRSHAQRREENQET